MQPYRALGRLRANVHGTPNYPIVAVNSIKDELNWRKMPNRRRLTERIQVPGARCHLRF